MNASGDGGTAAVRTSVRAEVKRRLREAILDAAADLASQHGWREVRISDIAAHVGVSRQTVHGEISTKDRIGQLLVLREAERFVELAIGVLHRHADDPVQGIERAAAAVLAEAGSTPLVRSILIGMSEGSDGLLELLTTRGRPVLELAATRLFEHFSQAFPRAAGPHQQPVGQQDLLQFAHTCVRLLISHFILPDEQPEQVAAHIAQLSQRYLDLRRTG